MMETREQLMDKIDSLFNELREYECELEDKKEQYIESVDNLYKLTAEGFEECQRRLIRLEETTCSIISHIKNPIYWLEKKYEEISQEMEGK